MLRKIIAFGDVGDFHIEVCHLPWGIQVLSCIMISQRKSGFLSTSHVILTWSSHGSWMSMVDMIQWHILTENCVATAFRSWACFVSLPSNNTVHSLLHLSHVFFCVLWWSTKLWCFGCYPKHLQCFFAVFHIVDIFCHILLTVHFFTSKPFLHRAP